MDTGRCVEAQKELFDTKRSALAKYQQLVVGRPGLRALLAYECGAFLAGVPGALGLWLRKQVYPRLVKRCGRNVVFGTHVVLRHPHKIEIGDDVVIDDHCLLDAKGSDNRGIRIGSGVFIGRNTILSCKNGDIELGDRVDIGFNCEIFSGSRVTVGADTMMAAYSFLIGGGHAFERTDSPVLEQPRTSEGIAVGEGVWIGAGVKVLDGVTLGDHAIVGAGAVVTRSVDAYMIAAGVPAAVLRKRAG